MSLLHLISKIVLMGVLFSSFSHSALASKRTTTDEIIKEGGQNPAQKPRLLDPSAQLTPDEFLEECIQKFRQARQQGNTEQEDLVCHNIATDLYSRPLLFVEKHQIQKKEDLLCAMYNVGGPVEKLLGPCHLTTLPPDVILHVVEVVYNDSTTLQQTVVPFAYNEPEDGPTSPNDYFFNSDGIRDIIRLQAVNKCFCNTVQGFRDKAHKIYLTSLVKRPWPPTPEESLLIHKSLVSFCNLGKAFPNFEGLVFSEGYFKGPPHHLEWPISFLTSLKSLKIRDCASNEHNLYAQSLNLLLSSTVTSLEFSYHGIFPTALLHGRLNLEHLDLRDNFGISSVTPTISGLTNLTSLAFSLRDLTQSDAGMEVDSDDIEYTIDLKFITCLPNLKNLALYDDFDDRYSIKSSETGLASLVGLTQLQTLWLGPDSSDPAFAKAEYYDHPVIRPNNKDLKTLLPLCCDDRKLKSNHKLTIDWGIALYFVENNRKSCNDGWQLEIENYQNAQQAALPQKQSAVIDKS